MSSRPKHIAFLTGTRADFGKIKPLIRAVEAHPDYTYHIFVTGMHMLEEYGFTAIEVEKSGFKNIFRFENHTSEHTMDLTLAKTIQGFSSFVREVNPDLVVVHGDRIEALAGATVGCLNNIPVAHIEGGEISGTIDELIRHSVSKLSHLHFVSNEDAARRLKQMGELDSSVHVIGSPDIDIMFSNDLPSFEEAKAYYQIPFERFAIGMLHPVTTEIDALPNLVKSYAEALLKSEQHFLLVYPNNDLGSRLIIEALEELKMHPRMKVIPSLRFEYFLSLLKNAAFIIGNSSAGIREAPAFGVPTVNIGTRQMNRSSSDSIIHCDESTSSMLQAIEKARSLTLKSEHQAHEFGQGNSTEKFMNWLTEVDLDQIARQKHFKDQ